MNPRFVFLWCGFFVVHLLADEGGNEEEQPPHIIIIMADDLVRTKYIPTSRSD